jgi:dihydrofolate reductase
MPKLLHVIVACAENRVIGRDRKLPWRIPEDLKFFHDETAGQICVLGRICYETWPRVHEDGRRPVVLTSRPLTPARNDKREEVSPSGRKDVNRGNERERVEKTGYHPAIAVRSLDEALAAAETLPGEIYICGGQRIYEETFALMPARRVRLHLTLIHADIPGDTFFPEWRHLEWRELSRHESRDENFRYTFLVLER